MSKKITFSLAPEIVADATEGIVLGDFNNWLHEAGIELKKQKDGSLKAAVNLEPGVYQYRYFLNDGRWVNDGNAQGYSFVGEFGVDNCIIEVPFEQVQETLATGQLVTDVEVKSKKAEPKKEVAAKAPVAEKPKAAAKKPAAPAKTEKAVAPKAVAKAAPKSAAKPAPKAASKKPAAKAVAPVAKKATKKSK